MKCAWKTWLLIAFAFLFGSTGTGNAGPQRGKSKAETKQTSNGVAKNNKVDLNTANEKELDQLPGVGPAYAKKIIENRPYSSVSELSKTGLPESTIKKIRPLVTAKRSRTADNSSIAKNSASAQEPPQKEPKKSKSSAQPSQSAAQPSQSASPQSAAPTQSPVAGMVWVNLDSGVYHHEGSRWYGKTKNGKYMSEADATKAGYRAAKNNE